MKFECHIIELKLDYLNILLLAKLSVINYSLNTTGFSIFVTIKELLNFAYRKDNNWNFKKKKRTLLISFGKKKRFFHFLKFRLLSFPYAKFKSCFIVTNREKLVSNKYLLL